MGERVGESPFGSGQVNNVDPAGLAILVRDIKVHVVQFHMGETE